MKDNKGFTLAELLGVIVLLGIISLIVVPRTLTTLSEARQASYQKSVQGFIEEIRDYLATDIDLNFDDGIEVNDLLNNYNIEGENTSNFTSGYISTDKNGNVLVYNLTDGVYCANGKRTDLKIRKNSCNVDYFDDMDFNDINLWESGTYSSTGVKSADATKIRTKNKFYIENIRKYYVSSYDDDYSITFIEYTSDGSVIKSVSNPSVLSLDSDVAYVSIVISDLGDSFDVYKDYIKTGLYLYINEYYERDGSGLN